MSPDIPPFNEQGHLPPGRYSVTLEQLEERFVRHADFASSETRPDRWRGFREYISLWKDVQRRVEQDLDRPLVKAIWLGGSFISAKLDPNNVDLALFVDGDSLAICKQKGQSGRISLLSGRDKMTRTLHVTPSIVPYRYVRSPWDMYRDNPAYQAPYTGEHFRYVGQRGCFDDWWLRMRPEGEDKGAPTAHTGAWARGYVEVML